MSRKAKYDVTLRIKGGRDGALTSDDLKKVIEFMTSVASQDDSLGDLCLVDIKSGSVEACFCLEPRTSSSGTLAIYSREEQIGALGAIFDQGRKTKSARLSLPSDVSDSLRPWTRAGLNLEISYRTNSNARLKTIAIDNKRLEKAAPKSFRPVEKKWIVGRVVRLIKDEQEYGIETAEGVLLCPMDEAKNSLYLDLYKRSVSVDVLASFPAKPPSGPWRARAIHEVVPQKEPVEPVPLLHDAGDTDPFDIENIPGIAKPKNPQTYGVSLAAFAAALTIEDRESLVDFFQNRR